MKAPKAGRYSLLLTSPNVPVTGECPCTLSVYVPKRLQAKFVAVPVGAAPLQPARFPILPRLNQPQSQSRYADDGKSNNVARSAGSSLTDELPAIPQAKRVLHIHTQPTHIISHDM